MDYNIKKTIILILFFIILPVSTCRATITISGGLTLGGGLEFNYVEPVILALGDSITMGARQTDGVGYRGYLYTLLGGAYNFVGNRYDRQIVTGEYYETTPTIAEPYFTQYGWHSGVSGEKTSEIESRTASDMAAAFPSPVSPNSIVLLHSGTNDRPLIDSDGAGPGAPDATDSVQNVINTIDIIKAYDPNIAIYVALIIPGSFSSGQWQDDVIQTFNSALDTALQVKQATTTELYIVNMNAAFKDTNNCPTDYTSCIYDTYHPNDLGYTVMAQEWATAILANE